MQVKRIVNSFYNSNTFVLSKEGSTNVWLVDCGDYSSQIRSTLKGKNIQGVLLTHTHYDHIYGLNDLVAEFPEVTIYTNEFGKVALSNPKLNISKYHTEISDFVICNKAKIVAVSESNEIILFPGVVATILSTPGHDKSCLSYIVENKLFTGDSYIPGERLVCTFPNSNKNDAKDSFIRLEDLSTIYRIYPGHGKII